jgi:threonyl-tRNA synthetase
MELEGVRYYIKPMNCPFHHKIFAPSRGATATCRCAWPSTAPATATRRLGELFGPDARALDADERRPHLLLRGAVRAGVHGRDRPVPGATSTCSASTSTSCACRTHRQAGWARSTSTTSAVAQDRGDGAQRHDQRRRPFVEVARRGRLLRPQDRRADLERHRREFTLATNQVDFAVPERFDLHLHQRARARTRRRCASTARRSSTTSA